jgi:hypothetical protein
MLLREGSDPAGHYSFQDLSQRVKECNWSPGRGDRVVPLAKLPQNNSGIFLEMGWVV